MIEIEYFVIEIQFQVDGKVIETIYNKLFPNLIYFIYHFQLIKNHRSINLISYLISHISFHL